MPHKVMPGALGCFLTEIPLINPDSIALDVGLIKDRHALIGG
jgi:hypothetical protein